MSELKITIILMHYGNCKLETAAYINIYYLGHRRPKLTSRVKVND